MSRRIRDMFNEIAHRYDFLNHALSFFRDFAWRRACCRNLSRRVPARSRVLDLCGGTGDFALSFKKYAGETSLMAVGDFSEQMLLKAKEKSNAYFPVELDAGNIPFRDSSFDVVLNGFGMRNVSDISRALAEVHRVLARGGYFTTLEFFRPDNICNRFFYQILAPLFIPVAGAFFSGKKEAYVYLVNSIRNFISVSEYTKLAETFGFEKVAVKACDGGIAYQVLLRKK
ncbi:MAG: ubiquinone/menaquinone biosynthesis methyltransferase [Fibrobacter sp.]|nr:ubiquinone/menaquinone biosynthesis methyltransferase [Fibrobacter sp.]